ncbi:hypothetical protein HK103_003226 [Boothiomyces macroporosus]|uniref:Protein-lysine N-methyltransferase EFM4 n=1 Tax=Boothiomyces macroporosus TaxID=261099 RepID=A0AAD5ULU5_9FUNG|nr:hypothetical protein HK103_003226 [Boothiomyces macroporosus]KAJ3311361.1 hypothetical protein HDV04_004073 [Boothiomyces sp. JEL0838]
MENIEELNASKLGTLEYWDTLYQKEVENFNDFGDEGEIWFGQDSAERMCEWVQDNLPSSTSILDLGTGNGHLLFELHSMGFTNLLGVDYAPNSIELCKTIANDKEMEIEFKVMDILQPVGLQFDLVMDKGTFDAISLSEIKEKKPTEQYVESVGRLVKQGGLFMITSCNWTTEELLIRFGREFEKYDLIKYPTFTFGGQQGQTITSVIFKKK